MNIRQAIKTKYLNPTNFKGARIVAECTAKRIVLGWKDELNPSENHVHAAIQLADSLGWKEALITGQLKSGEYVHVFKGEK